LHFRVLAVGGSANFWRRGQLWLQLGGFVWWPCPIRPYASEEQSKTNAASIGGEFSLEISVAKS